VRTTPAESHAELYERLRRYLRCELLVHSDRLVPTETDAGAAIVRAVQNALPGSLPAGSPTMSDMVYLQGTASVKIGPGDSSRSHTPDEYVLADELQAGAQGYQRIVREYFDVMGRAKDNSTSACAHANERGGLSE
jgi:acetylornithine deacetylase